MTTAWLLLLAAGVLEIGWAIGPKHTGGWTRVRPRVVAVAGPVLSVMMLSYARKTLPVGTGAGLEPSEG